MNSGTEDIDGLSGGLGEVPEPHGHRQVQLSGATVRRQLDLHFRAPVAGEELRLRPVLAGEPREHVKRLPALVGLGSGTTGLIHWQRAGVISHFPDFMVLEAVLLGVFGTGQLLDEVGEGVVGQPDHLGSLRTHRAGFVSMHKSGILDGLEDFLPEGAEVGGDRSEAVLGCHFVDNLFTGSRLIIQIFLRLLLDVRVRRLPGRSRFLALKFILYDYNII